MAVRAGRILVIALLVALAGPIARAQESERPMSEAELISLVNAKTPEDKLIAEVKSRGITFKPSAGLEDGLRKLKLTRLLATLIEPGTIEVTVNLPGADVLVDAEKRGAVPADGKVVVSGLAPGEHSVKVHAEDYVDANLDVFLKPGETRALKAELRQAVSATPGPLGMRVSVSAGTPADAALAQLEFAREPAARIEMLTKLVHDFDRSPLALLGYGMLQDAYIGAEQYDQALAAGQELLRRDPKNFSARVHQVQAYLGKGEVETAFQQAQEAHAQVEQLEKNIVPPMGADPAAWERDRQQLLESARGEWGNLSYTAFVAVSQVPDPARKRGLLEQFVELFPQSAYKEAAVVQLAVTAQQLGDADGALRWANAGLEANPNQGTLLVLAADVLGDTGKDLGRGREFATRLLGLIQNEPDKVRPAGLSDEQWAAQQKIWQGLAHSALGQINMYEGKAPAGIEEFRTAAPFFAGQPGLEARNLYRLGYALASVGGRGNLQEAQTVLSQVVALNSPYAAPARDLLAKVEAALRPRH